MKKLTVFCATAFALIVSAEVFAQARGPRYNPGGGGGSSSSGGSRSSGGSSSSSPSRSSRPSSSSSPRGPRYNPTPSTPSSSSSSSSSTPSSSSSSTPRGPRYNPNPSSNPSTPSTPSTGSVSVPRGARYNNNPASANIPTHQQNPGAVLVRRTITHVPRVIHSGPIRFHTPHDYYVLVNRRFIYRSWLQEPVSWYYNDGYWDFDGYPYYVHRSYRYRYSPVEMCQYELVDGNDYTVTQTFPVEACTTAYDACAVQRDALNSPLGIERYFCAEKVDAELAQQPTEVFQASTTDISDAQEAAISSWLSGMEYKDIFDEGRDSVGNCSIWKNGGVFSSGNDFKCRWTVKVGDKAFPLTDESVCSDDDAAAKVGCNVGNEKENAGCILKQAIQAGLCL
jgi:hypothetical protein